MSPTGGEGREGSPSSSRGGVHKANRDVLNVEAQTTGDITTGPDLDQHVDNRPTFINSNTVVREGNAASVLVAAILALLAIAGVWRFGPAAALGGLERDASTSRRESPEVVIRKPESLAPPPPELPSVSTKPLVPGKTWVAAAGGEETWSWNGVAARAFLDRLSDQVSGKDLAFLPQALRPRLEQLTAADSELAPGGGLAPEGTELLYSLLLDVKPLSLPGPTEAVSLSCEVIVVSFREPEIAYRQVLTHTGQGPSSSAAVDMAVGRCLAEMTLS